MRVLMLALALTTTSGLAVGQEEEAIESEDRIVVTGARLSEFEMDFVPAVTLKVRADEVAVQTRFVCDTRDRVQRERELRQTLRNLVRAADRDPSIDVGVFIEGEDGWGVDRVEPFQASMIDTLEFDRDFRRSDTSRVELSIVLRVGPNDTSASLEQRYEAFLEAIEMEGRSEAVPSDDAQLSVFGGPIRYRQALIDAIRADAEDVASSFGPQASYTLSGLQGDVRWQRVGELMLDLYIGYEMSIQPN